MNLPLQCFFSKEVTFAQSPDELFFKLILRSDRNFHLTFRDDEESVATSTLTNDVIAFLVVAFFQHIGNLDERIFFKIFEDGNAGIMEAEFAIKLEGLRTKNLMSAIKMRFGYNDPTFSVFQCHTTLSDTLRIVSHERITQ